MPDITFLSPWAFAVGLLALLGVGVLVHSERRSRRLCAVLGLDPRPARSVAIDVAALAAVGLLLGLAAAQPVFSQVRPTSGRSDAEAIVVFDISRSMLAQQGTSAPTRLERARDVAKRIRAGMPEVPVYRGVDRPLVRTDVKRGMAERIHGDMLDLPAASKARLQPEHAVDWLIETYLASDGDIVLCPVGPLTRPVRR